MNQINTANHSADSSNTDSTKAKHDLVNSLSMNAERRKQYHNTHVESNFPLFDMGIFMDSVHNIDFSGLSYKALLKEKIMKWFRIGKKFSAKKDT